MNQCFRGEMLTMTCATAKAGDALTLSRWLDLLVKTGLGRPLGHLGEHVHRCVREGERRRPSAGTFKMWP